MRFSDIIQNIHIVSTNILSFNYCINKPVSDSTLVSRGDVYICKCGHDFDGHEFIAEAVNNGAGTIVAQRITPYMCEHNELRYITVSDTAIAEVLMLDSYYHHPTNAIKVIGITGTNGKTSIAYMLREIIIHAGNSCGMIGTVKNMINYETIDDNTNHMTTPPPNILFKTLDIMRNRHAEYAVIEASSHALDQKRLDAIKFELGIFTNLTEDHLDYHKNFENYKKAKAHLFDLCKSGLINTDSAAGKELASSADCSIKTFSLGDSSADFYADSPEYSASGVSYELNGIKIRCKVPGTVGVFNSLAAVSAAIMLGIPCECAASAIENMPQIPGRIEKLDLPADFSIYIDYAHTPDALKKVISTLRPLTKGRFITVFGCGGNREKEKRPIMGELACDMSDLTILTSDNPRFESPDTIIDDIKAGIPSGASYKTIPARKDAILYALNIAEKGDTVLLAGKGHEDYEIVGSTNRHFSEKEIINEYFKERAAINGSERNIP